MARSAECPGDPTHGWHGNTQTLYAKEKNTMVAKAIICDVCDEGGPGVWIKESPRGSPKELTWRFYKLDPEKKSRLKAHPQKTLRERSE